MAEQRKLEIFVDDGENAERSAVSRPLDAALFWACCERRIPTYCGGEDIRITGAKGNEGEGKAGDLREN